MPRALLIALSALLASSATAQTRFASCDPPAEVEQLTPFPARPKPGIDAPRYRAALDAHKEDAALMMLYGRALVGKNTPEAIVQLNRAAEAAPDMPWTYLTLQTVYSSRNFRDETKLIENVQAYHRLCPANVDGYAHLNKITDPAWNQQLRTLLEKRSDPGDGRYWSRLWAAEFRAAPQSEYGALRQRVAVDVQRLEQFPEPHKDSLRWAIADGYKLSGQIGKGVDEEEEAFKARKALDARLGPIRSSAEHEAYMKALAIEAAGWIKKWPTARSAWNARLSSVTYQEGWTNADLEKAGEEVLKAEAAEDFGWTEYPDRLSVARIWIAHGVRPKESLARAEESLREILLGPEEFSDLNASPGRAGTIQGGSYGFDSQVCEAMAAIVEASDLLKDFSKAHAMLGRMSQWMSDNAAKRDDPASSYTKFEAQYYETLGRTAEAEGKNLDAAAFYAKARPGYILDRDARHAHEFWISQGGSEEAWKILTARPVPAKRTTAPTTAQVYAPWTPSNRPLPDSSLKVYNGGVWTPSTFKGKTTFLNVWATWCPPCVEELPYVQKLYELTKDSQDFQVVTLNLETNPGALEPFLKQTHYTFPILLNAEEYVTSVAGTISIPRNWIVDQTGALRLESIGFDAMLPDWPGEMLKKMKSVKTN